ncbi:unnamed protein product [Oppiella nova]|uniref:Uncharacterized protein n=1 Tax=Oppiella nova TaxID=334625 RepID=A0A7R9LN15_9ACAR|nr:unnamed protein product [Oppiella nova]CAG2165244.1 unnamed protein product [Oppiella nova]
MLKFLYMENFKYHILCDSVSAFKQTNGSVVYGSLSYSTDRRVFQLGSDSDIEGKLLARFTIHTTTVPFIWNNTTYYDCRGAEMDGLMSQIYNTSVFMLTFAFPLLIQTFSYFSIGRKLLKDKVINKFNRESFLSPVLSLSRFHMVKKIIRMLIAVVIVFSITTKVSECCLEFLESLLVVNKTHETYQPNQSFEKHREIKLALRKNSGHERDRAKIIRMLIAVVIVFISELISKMLSGISGITSCGQQNPRNISTESVIRETQRKLLSSFEAKQQNETFMEQIVIKINL